MSVEMPIQVQEQSLERYARIHHRRAPTMMLLFSTGDIDAALLKETEHGSSHPRTMAIRTSRKSPPTTSWATIRRFVIIRPPRSEVSIDRGDDAAKPIDAYGGDAFGGAERDLF